MAEDEIPSAMPKSGQRLLEQLDRLVDAGQVTAEEASALRAATNAEDYEAAVVRIRSRHARARLEVAVERGQMTQAGPTSTWSRYRMASIPGVSERTYGRSRRMSTEPRPQDHAGDERKTEAETGRIRLSLQGTWPGAVLVGFWSLRRVLRPVRLAGPTRFFIPGGLRATGYTPQRHGETLKAIAPSESPIFVAVDPRGPPTPCHLRPHIRTSRRLSP